MSLNKQQFLPGALVYLRIRAAGETRYKIGIVIANLHKRVYVLLTHQDKVTIFDTIDAEWWFGFVK